MKFLSFNRFMFEYSRESLLMRILFSVIVVIVSLQICEHRLSYWFTEYLPQFMVK